MDWKFESGQRISFALMKNGKIKGFVFLFEDEPLRTKFVGQFPVHDKLKLTDGSLEKAFIAEVSRQGRAARQDPDLKSVFWVT